VASAAQWDVQGISTWLLTFGYCVSQGIYYFGYKLHALCGLSGVIHSYDLSKASVHDTNYLKDVKQGFYNIKI
jgi:hypothetical protein